MAPSRWTDRKKYGVIWAGHATAIDIELECIRRGGKWKNKAGVDCGDGLFNHYRNAQSILWPEDSHNRWSDLVLKSILENSITTIMGPKSSGKTHTCAKYALIAYLAFPDDTTILMSSTDVRGLELRVWGDLKSLFKRAVAKFEDLPGHCLESKHAIATDNLRDEDVRDLRNGIICIPCLTSTGSYVGLGRYSGIKNTHVRLVSDECQFMSASFLDAVSNLDSNQDFKAVFLGNPLDPYDPLGKAAEPKNGWTSMPEPEKTETWRSRFQDGITVNLVGTDSPNFDYPQDQKPHFPYLISKRTIDSTIAFYGAQSQQYYTQCKGVMKTGLVARRVITRDLCVKFKASNEVIWDNSPRTKVYGLDAAYGSLGGDRCVGIVLEFGKEVGGGTVISVGHPTIIPVYAKGGEVSPEDQIAAFVKEACELESIVASNVFFDATGRGSLGTSFARLWSAQINPVEFGGSPTPRPVSADLHIFDTELKIQRLKLCNEHYSKFVTELWFSTRYAIEAGQVRNLGQEIIEEGCMREWKIVRGDKIEVETKDDMKERMGRSPDLYDAFAVALEGARRRGFLIARLSNVDRADDFTWLKDLGHKYQKLSRQSELVYS
jgi:hypothetical protein